MSRYIRQTMNIFYLDPDPTNCAEFHMDKHVIKMILEYCQLLSTAHRVLDGEEYFDYSRTGRRAKRFKLPDDKEQIIYSATHINHPSAVWARASRANYNWLHSLLVALCKEYTYRYGRVHKCESSGLVSTLAIPPLNIDDGEFTEPTPAMPKEHIVANDSIASYRKYYINDKVRFSSWKKRNEPDWFKA